MELLGFDYRYLKDYYVNDRWPTSSREKYLLRADIPWPMSVDIKVWPSIFRYNIEDHPSAYLQSVIDIKPNNVRQESLRLWGHFLEMESYISNKFPDKRKLCCPIGVTLLIDNPQSSSEYWDAVLYPPNRLDEVPHDWILLGYDIADIYMTSGLFNIEYSNDGMKQMQQKWSSFLNKYGLFNSPENAKQFALVSDKSWPMHSPFYIYGLYRIGQSDSTILG